ncbi:hypothetical protein GJ496_004167 [Pomphorhynchus laevis]|nr:hypothetical protein GJ496_004167 [Pomphorhynchus laevis]
MSKMFNISILSDSTSQATSLYMYDQIGYTMPRRYHSTLTRCRICNGRLLYANDAAMRDQNQLASTAKH